jgi:hypothetical protein
MASKEVLDKVENTLDSTADTLETLERIPKLALNGTTKKQQLIILGTVSGVSALTGIVLTVAAHRGKLKLRRRMNHKTIEDFAAGKDVS